MAAFLARHSYNGRKPARELIARLRDAAEGRAGELVVGQVGCLACHTLGDSGNSGPGPPLTHIGKILAPGAIASTLINPTAPMPSFAGLQKQGHKFQNVVGFLSLLQ